MHSDKTWEVVTITDRSTFDVNRVVRMLADGDIAAVRIPGVYASEEIDVVVSNIQKQGVHWYPNFEFKQGRIGICATEYTSKINGKEAYFILEPESSRIRDAMFPGDLSPVKRMVDVLSQNMEVGLATEPSMNGAQYFTGLVRAMLYKSTTHFDYAPKQLPGWWVAGAEAQFAVVTYLQLPGAGGELTVYNRQWQEEDESYNHDVKEKGPRGFDSDFLNGVESVTIAPNPGEMIIFNSRNFHEVAGIESEKTRFSINSFMVLKDGGLHLWN